MRATRTMKERTLLANVGGRHAGDPNYEGANLARECRRPPCGRPEACQTELPGVYLQDALETSLFAHNMLPAC